MVTLTPGFVPVSDAPSADVGSIPSEHAFVCLMSLCATYATHGKLPIAAECAWSAFDCARLLKRPDLAFESLIALDAIVTVATANGVSL